MKGYLHNLLMRSMGVAETVQPRLASLFEPHTTNGLTQQLEQRAYAQEPARDTYEDERTASLSSSPSSSEVRRPAPLQRERTTLREVSLSTAPSTDDAPSSFESERPASPRIFVEKPQTRTLDANRDDASHETRETVLPQPLKPPAQKRESRAESIEAQPVTQSETVVESGNTQASLLARVSRLAHTTLPAETIRAPERLTHAQRVQSTRDTNENAPSAYEKDEVRASSQPEALVESARSSHEEAKTIIREVAQRTVERELLIEKPQPVLPDEHSTVREAQERAAPLSLRPRISPRAEERRTILDEAQNERASEPVIHVSIGRIEVRAVTKEVRPLQQRATAKPAESLEDYLRQRAKGGSR